MELVRLDACVMSDVGWMFVSMRYRNMREVNRLYVLIDSHDLNGAVCMSDMNQRTATHWCIITVQPGRQIMRPSQDQGRITSQGWENTVANIYEDDVATIIGQSGMGRTDRHNSLWPCLSTPRGTPPTDCKTWLEQMCRFRADSSMV
jgi:hypothetical protein